MERIGIIGLGRMGSAMATRMAGQGAQVTGWTRSGLTPDRAAALGITATPDIATLVAASDVIVTSLLDDSAVDAVLDALLSHDLTGKLIAETSTVTPTPLTSRLDRITAAGGAAVDAPISGGPEMVAAGTCGLFIGGSDVDAARATGVFNMISGRIFHVGPLGTGLVMKTINNSMIQAYLTSLREFLPMAKRANLPFETVMDILNGGPVGIAFMRDRMPKLLGQDETVGFTVAAGVKDAKVFGDVLASYGLSSPILARAEEGLRAAVEAGLGDHDPAVYIARAYHDG